MSKEHARRQSPKLLERERELEAIEVALAGARAGEGRLLYIEAHAGIGKSGLLAAAREQASTTGMDVLAGRGSVLERDHSFGVATQLLEPPLARATEAAREDLLGGAAALARPLFENHAIAAAAPEDQLFSLLHGLYWLTSNLAERRPLLIAADDGHWTDRSSLRFFLYLAQRLRDLPVALLTAARPAEPGASEDLLRQLKSHEATEVLGPRALTRHGVEGVVKARMPRPEAPFVDACAEVTDGNPYLLNELLADAEDRGTEPTAASAELLGQLAPDSVLQAALVRLTRLPSGASAVARAVAVLGEEAGATHAADLAGLDRDEAGAAADALVAAELLRPGEPLAFVHPLLHSAIYADTPASERARAHAAAARMLERDGAAWETVAAHLLGCNPSADAWTVEQLRGAAKRSLAQGAPESAVRYLTRALEEPPPPESRPDVLVELGQAESLAGKAGAIVRLEQALELIDDPRRRADILRDLGWTLQKTGDLRGAVEAFDRGLAELGKVTGTTTGGDAALQVEVASLQNAHLGAAMLEPGYAERAHQQLAGLAEKPAAELSPGERGLVSVAAMHLLFRGEDHERVIALCERAWGAGQLLEEEGSNSPTIYHVFGLLSWADALEASEPVIEATLEAARREGSITTMAICLYGRAWPRYWRGDLAGAMTDAQAAVDAWSGEYSMYLPVAAYWLALSLLERDEVDAAAHAIDFPDAEERWGQTNMYGALLAAQGRVASARGDHGEAVRRHEAAGNSVIGSVVANPAVIPWRSYLSEARLAAGDRDGAREAAEEEVRRARKFGAARPIGIGLRAAGLAEGGARGLELLAEAVEVLRSSPSALELARALIDAGAAVRRDGRPGDAREPLREGLDMAQRLGAVVLERQASDELLASGVRPRRRQASGVDALTPSERRVAEMAAEGMTNREIAQSLFVTVNAVRFHLRNTYVKLEVSSREELGVALGHA